MVPGAGAVRVVDYGFIGATQVQTLELSLPAAAAPGVTIEIPLNKSATILEARIDLLGAPALNSTVLRGWGTVERNREDFGLPMGRGDFNGDGKSDLVAGAPMRNIPDSPGRVEVRYGRAGGVNLTPDWQYIGPSGIQFAGSFQSGDFNGDNYDDLVVGEQNAGYQGTPPEQAFIFYGSALGLAASPALVMESDDPFTETGYANAVTAADLNGDGYAEAVVAELRPGLDSLNGRLWVHWGGPSGISPSNFTFIYPPGPDYFEWGYPFYPIGDSDGDGLGEIFTASIAYHDRSGGAVIIEGVQGSTATNVVWVFNGSLEVRTVRDGFAAGHDITGDDLPDVVVGFNAANDTRGGLYWIPGLANGSYNNSAGTVVLGENPGDSFSSSAMIGDVDGDGLGDLAVGATHTYSDAEGGAYLFTRGELRFESAGFIPLGIPGAGEGCGDDGAFLGDLNGDGVGDFGFACPYGVNGSYAPGRIHVLYGDRHPFPENASVRIGSNVVWSRAGPMKGPATPSGFAPELAAYLAIATADAAGTVRVPVSFSFENGGRMSVQRIFIRYTVLLEPGSVAAYSDPSGEAVVVAWAVRSPKSDGDMTAVWSNKTGPWEIVANVSSSRGSFVDLGVVRGTEYWYSVTEWDAFLGMHGPRSANVSARATDTKPPAPPTFQSLVLDIPNTAVTLRWAAAADDTDTWEVWRRNGDVAPFVRVASLPRAQVAYSDAALEAEVNLTWKLAAVDASGIVSAFSEERAARLPDLTPPPRVLGLTGRALPTGTEVELSWTANTYDTVEYEVNVSAPGTPSGFERRGATTGTSFVVGGLQRLATYYVQVKAVDRAGQRSEPTQVTVDTADTTAPSPPTLQAAFSPPSGRSVRVTWTVADDDISTFHVSWLQGGLPGPGADLPGEAREYTVSGLLNDLPVEVRVSAEDAGGFRSADSVPITAVPHDLLPPGIPTGVRVTSLPEGGALRIEWFPPADADVVGYKVYIERQSPPGPRALAGAVGGGALTFEKRGLDNQVPYLVVVSAIDQVANEGNFSMPVTGIPRDTKPPATPRFDGMPGATKDASLVVSGRADPGVDVRFTVNGAAGDLHRTLTSGRFEVTVPLRLGANTIVAEAIDPDTTAEAAARISDPTETLTVLLDTAAPRVTSVVPSAGSDAVGPRPSIEVRFDELPLASSIVVTLSSPSGEVSTHLTLDVATDTLVITPDRDLAPGERYTLSIAATDEAGNAVAFPPVTFTTASAGGGDTTLFVASAAVVAAAAAVTVVRRRRASGKRD